MIVELAGAPGAGKTSVARALHGRTIGRARFLSGDAAVTEYLDRSLITRVLVRGAGKRRADRIRRVAVDVPGGAMTVLAHPLLTVRVLRSVVAAPVSTAHRVVLVRRFLVAAARITFLRRHVRPGEIVLVDEGLVHRVVNVFAWRTGMPGDAEVRAYVRTIPPPDALIVLEASSGARDQRLRERGLPTRLVGRSPTTVAGFLDRADQLLGTATAIMSERVPTLVVGSAGPLEETVQRVADVVMRVGGGEDSALGPEQGTWPMWPADLPRPDRALRWPPLPRRPTVSDPALEAVLEELRRKPAGTARPVRAGRSQATVVPTERGRLLVKRYKDTLDDAAIANEHAVLRELAAKKIPAPRLVVGEDGLSCVRTDGGRYAAYDYLDGYHPAHERIVPRSVGITIGGVVLAGIHRALADFAPPADSAAGLVGASRLRVRDATWHVDLIAESLAVRLEGDDELRRRAAWIQNELEALERGLVELELPTVTIHGDYGPYNLLVRAGAPVVPIDFELARLDWRIVDLVTSLPRFATGRLGRHRGAAERFLAAYETHSPLLPIERAAMPRVTRYLALRRAAITWHRATTGQASLAEARSWLRRAIERDTSVRTS